MLLPLFICPLITSHDLLFSTTCASIYTYLCILTYILKVPPHQQIKLLQFEGGAQYLLNNFPLNLNRVLPNVILKLKLLVLSSIKMNQKLKQSKQYKIDFFMVLCKQRLFCPQQYFGNFQEVIEIFCIIYQILDQPQIRNANKNVHNISN